MSEITSPTWKQIGDLHEENNNLLYENALKLQQILDLEQILYNTRKTQFDEDCGACWCEGYVQEDGHLDFCQKARKATEPFWKK